MSNISINNYVNSDYFSEIGTRIENNFSLNADYYNIDEQYYNKKTRFKKRIGCIMSVEDKELIEFINKLIEKK